MEDMHGAHVMTIRLANIFGTTGVYRMKTCFANQYVFRLITATLGFVLAGTISAQSFKTLHSFTALDGDNANTDGAGPFGGVILSGKTLYGTTYVGGSTGKGTVFAINTDGTGFRPLHIFPPFVSENGINKHGAFPMGALILSSNTLYGTAFGGGISGNGTLFAINTDGTGFRTLHSFKSITDGAFPAAGMVLSDNTLYGTTSQGGVSNSGTLFRINTDGTGFTNLHSFSATSDAYPFTNDDGKNPHAVLILSGNTLYGTAAEGGNYGGGTVFQLNTDGTDFETLHTFTGGSDGASPAGLALSKDGQSLYGVTTGGGNDVGDGTVFRMRLGRRVAFETLYTFADGNDGTVPDPAGLILSSDGNTLYGIRGSVFSIGTDGTGFEALHTFNGEDGRGNGLLLLSGTLMYGTTIFGGASPSAPPPTSPFQGTVFSLSLAPQLSLVPYGANSVLTWPTNYAGFDYTSYSLESSTNLIGPQLWSAVPVKPIVLNGQNVVFDPNSSAQRFYRLSK
jgi:uncharacterized repeat protein (TIGR03803 family)